MVARRYHLHICDGCDAPYVGEFYIRKTANTVAFLYQFVSFCNIRQRCVTTYPPLWAARALLARSEQVSWQTYGGQTHSDPRDLLRLAGRNQHHQRASVISEIREADWTTRLRDSSYPTAEPPAGSIVKIAKVTSIRKAITYRGGTKWNLRAD